MGAAWRFAGPPLVFRPHRVLAMIHFATLTLLVLAAATASSQEADLSIVVRGGDTGAPLPGAVIEIMGARGAVDAFGQADLSGVPVGDIPLTVSYPGYATLDTLVAVAVGEANLTVLSLRSEARDLGDVTVEAETPNDAVLRRRGFFDRQSTNTGVFFTREELDRRGVTLFSDIFGPVPGVRVQRRGGQAQLISSRRRGCLMTVYLDGTEMAYIASNIDALPFDDVAAIEIYRGPSELPLEYAYMKSNDTCGAVLVWTRISAGN